MTTCERVLRVLRARAEIELLEAGANLARAMERTTTEERRCRETSERVDTAGEELRRVMALARINPALIDVMRRMYHDESLSLERSRERLRQARQGEQQEHVAVTRIRSDMQAIRAGLRAQRRSRLASAQRQDERHLDDWWLQRVMRGLP